MAVELPQALIDAVKEERAVLFLGAGASKGAAHPNNLAIPDGDGLRDFLCDRFFAGSLKKRSLPQVTDLAINERGFREVQSTIGSLLRPFEPADFHRLIPTFRWRAIVTTNVDLIVQRAYMG